MQLWMILVSEGLVPVLSHVYHLEWQRVELFLEPVGVFACEGYQARAHQELLEADQHSALLQ